MMRTLEINKRSIYYANRIGDKENELGEKQPVYSSPQSISIRVDYTKTTAKVAMYGRTSDCTVKLISDRDLGFNLDTIFWIDAPVALPHDYIMGDKPDKTVNGVVYRLKEVGVAYAD